MMVIEAHFDPIGKARERGRLLDLIPEPVGPVYDAASHVALVRAGVSEENIGLIEAANNRPEPMSIHRR